MERPSIVELCFALQYDNVPGGKIRIGQASTFMQRINKERQSGQTNQQIKVLVKDSTFHLPKSKDLPVIMIGPGAGIAPFKGFADEKAFLNG